jgi:hypothetical protein
MKKISASALIDFRRRSPKGKQNFVAKLKATAIPTKPDGGGNYWISALSATQHAYQDDDTSIADEKIIDLRNWITGTKHTITRNMYQANITLLDNYKGMDHSKLRPTSPLTFLKKSGTNSILSIKGLQVEIRPAHVFSFGKKGKEEVGAICFVAKKDGYNKSEIGLFCDLLYRYLRVNFSKNYTVSTKYCIAVDLASGSRVHYDDIVKGGVVSVVNTTLDDINKLI